MSIALLGSRLVDIDRLEAAGERRILLEILAVFGQVVAAIVRSVPRASAGLSRLAASPVPACPPAPIRVCASSMNRMIGLGLDSTSSITARRRFSNSPFMLAPACIRPMSSARSVTPLQRGRHVAVGDALGEAFDHRGLADAGLADEDRVVLAPAHQDVDDLPDFVVAADDRIDLALARLRGQVDRIAFQRFSLAAWNAAGVGAGFRRGLAAALRRFARRAQQRVEFVRELVHLDLPEFGAGVEQRIPERRRFQHAVHEMAGAHARCGKLEGGIKPALLDGFFDLRREVRDRGCPARELVERFDDISRQLRIVELEGRADQSEIVPRILQQDVDPVDQLHIGVAPHLAEARRGFDGLEGCRHRAGQTVPIG